MFSNFHFFLINERKRRKLALKSVIGVIEPITPNNNKNYPKKITSNTNSEFKFFIHIA